MKHIIATLALALSGAVVVSAGAYAAQTGQLRSPYEQIAATMGPMGIAAPDGQRDVIEPPSSVDPGMALDPPQTGAKMPVIHPPGTAPSNRLILPR
jgi:hypothetical protein